MCGYFKQCIKKKDQIVEDRSGKALVDFLKIKSEFSYKIA